MGTGSDGARAQVPGGWDPPPGRPLVSVEIPAELDHLLARAAEAIARADWKLAIDSLQRVIDDDQGALIAQPREKPYDFARFESVRTHAQRMLSALPPEGLNAYRILHNGHARRLLEEARGAHDAPLLRETLERYLVTDVAGDAADLLASWALDEGRPVEALRALHLVRSVRSPSDLPGTWLDVKQAVALAMLGRNEAAQRILFEGRVSSADTKERISAEEAERMHAVAAALESFGPDARRTNPSLTDPAAFECSPSGIANATARWPYVGGRADRTAIMPEVHPRLVDAPLWNRALPGATPDLWRMVDDRPGGARYRPPTANVVVEAGRVFTRTVYGVAAFDARSLDRVWEARTDSDVSSRHTTAGSSLRRRNRLDADRLYAHAFEDYVAGGVALADGSVFIIDRGSTGLGTQEEEDPLRAMGWIGRGRFGFRPPPPRPPGLRLIALDQRDGSVVWQRGQTSDALDPLGSVQFRALPLALGDEVWVPVVRAEDLLLAVLDPRDGRLLDEVLLCGLSNAAEHSGASWDLAAQDGVLLATTGHGVLFAVDVARRSPLWATQYGAAIEGRGWLSGPPLVAGGMVLLAAVEHGDLVAISAIDGTHAWSRPPAGHQYLIGANDRYVWLGGERVSCLKVSSGQEVWSTTLPERATARAIRSGDRLLVPTAGGLTAIDLEDGRVESTTPLEGSQPPMGNLLACDGALFSVDPAGIRKFPDPVRGPERSRAESAADPGALAPRIDLARAAYLQGDPSSAQEQLDALPPRRAVQDAFLRHGLQVLRVAVALDLAETLKAPEQRVAILDRALADAVSVDDRLRCGIALARALGQSGRVSEAFDALWALGLDGGSDALLRTGDGGWQPARRLVGEQLGDVLGRLDATDHDKIVAEARVLVDRATAALEGDAPSDARRVLEALDTLGAPREAAQRARVALARSCLANLRYEEAEQYLTEVTRNHPVGETALTVQLLLADLYRDPLFHRPRALRACLDELERSFGDAPIPRAYTGPTRSSPGKVRDWVAHLRSLAEQSGSSQPEWSADLAFSVRPDRWAWRADSAGGEIPTFFEIEGHGSPLWWNQFVQDVGDDALISRGVADGAFRWGVDLRVSGEFRSWRTALERVDTFRTVHPVEPIEMFRRCVADGNVAVLASRGALHGIGLATGKRLWSVPFDLLDDAAGDRDDALDAADGRVACTVHGDRVSLLRAVDGEVVWEQELRGHPADIVRIWGSSVAAIDDTLRHVALFDLPSGRPIARIRFEQPHPGLEHIALIAEGGVVCGPCVDGQTDGVKGVDLATGAERWRVMVRRPLAQIFRTAPGEIGVSTILGDVLVLDAADGSVRHRLALTGAPRILDGVRVEDTLVVAEAVARSGQVRVQYAAYDLGAQVERWRRADLVCSERWMPELRVLGTSLPLLYWDDPDRGPSRGSAVLLDVVDVHSGAPRTVSMEILSRNSRAVPMGRFVIRRGALIIPNTSEFRAFGTVPLESGEVAP
jgi:outer membrane protein assembly factor BamB